MEHEILNQALGVLQGIISLYMAQYNWKKIMWKKSHENRFFKKHSNHMKIWTCLYFQVH